MPALIAVCVAIALFTGCALVLLILTKERSPAEARLAQIRSRNRLIAEAEPSNAPSLRDMLAVITRPLSPFRNWLKSNDEELSYRLGLAGFRKPEDADTFLTLKLLSPIVGILVATFIAPLHDLILYGLILGVASFFLPDMLLFYMINQRKIRIGRALPDALDLLVICMEAGLGIDQAVLRIATEIAPVQPELSEELFIIGREQRAGKPRLDAWRSMSDRVDLDTVRQFVAMLVQTERLGTPVARALSQFADALRAKRLMQAEEHAAKTTIKLIFPLTLFIFPAIFIVLLGPGVLTIMKNFEDLSR